MTTKDPEVVGYLVEITNDPDIGAFFMDRDPALKGWVANPLIHLSDYEALQAECEALREDAELGRSVREKRVPGVSYGCHCDLEEHMQPDGCVIDAGERHNCIYASHIEAKEQCKYWRVIATDTAIQEAERGG